jgi:hypothetical protein
MYVEAFNSMIMGIHLALEVKPLSATLCLRQAPVWNPVLRNLEFPLIAVIGITEKKLQSKA